MSDRGTEKENEERGKNRKTRKEKQMSKERKKIPLSFDVKYELLDYLYI